MANIWSDDTPPQRESCLAMSVCMAEPEPSEPRCPNLDDSLERILHQVQRSPRAVRNLLVRVSHG